jgi:hypothetical protein
VNELYIDYYKIQQAIIGKIDDESTDQYTNRRKQQNTKFLVI